VKKCLGFWSDGVSKPKDFFPCIPWDEHRERIRSAVDDAFEQGLVSQSIPKSVKEMTDKTSRKVNKLISLAELKKAIADIKPLKACEVWNDDSQRSEWISIFELKKKLKELGLPSEKAKAVDVK